MNDQNHIIQKLNVEVNVPNPSMARRIHNNIGSILHDTVLPAVELKLNDLIKKEEYYRAGTITLDLSFDRESDLENLLAHALSSALANEATGSSGGRMEKKDIESALFDPGNERQNFQKKTGSEKSWDVFIWFLQTGRRPWYAGAETTIDEGKLLELIANDDRKKYLKELFFQSPLTAQRLIKQFSHEFIFQVAKEISGILIEIYWERIKHIQFTDNAEENSLSRKAILLQLFVVAIGNHSFDKARERMEIIVADNSIQLQDPGQRHTDTSGKDAKPETNKKKHPPDETEGIYVQNSGLILLHPFLLYFFKEFDLLNSADSFKDEACQQTAVHLLHYLATGKEEPFEYELLLEKFLCGHDIDEPAERFVTLTDKMKAECDHFLQAVIHHWKVLKNTSPDGLRQAFLQRPGKLSLTDYQHRLIVESGTVDILLNQLPWNYSIIQLPWLKQVFYVDWLTN
jgi:hypothetical protein